MRIGVDLDNTIVCYDRLFHAAALEWGLIPAHLPASKAAVRDHLRAVGQEDRWTELQGFVYGPGMAGAEPYPGVWEFFQACATHGVELRVISHKTRLPIRGPAYDLHEAARDWIFKQAAACGNPIDPGAHVHLELTKAEKLARIDSSGCDWFVDDLPEFLAEPDFPKGVRAILFDPTNALVPPRRDIHRVTSWRSLHDELFGASTQRTPHG